MTMLYNWAEQSVCLQISMCSLPLGEGKCVCTAFYRVAVIFGWKGGQKLSWGSETLTLYGLEWCLKVALKTHTPKNFPGVNGGLTREQITLVTFHLDLGHISATYQLHLSYISATSLSHLSQHSVTPQSHLDHILIKSQSDLCYISVTPQSNLSHIKAESHINLISVTSWSHPSHMSVTS